MFCALTAGVEQAARSLSVCAIVSWSACVLKCSYPAGTPRVGDRSPVHPCAGSGSHHRKTGSTHQTAVTLCRSLNQGEWRTGGEFVHLNDNMSTQALFPVVTWLIGTGNEGYSVFLFCVCFKCCLSALLQIAPAEGMDAKQRMVIIVGPPEAQFKVMHLHSCVTHKTLGRKKKRI